MPRTSIVSGILALMLLAPRGIEAQSSFATMDREVLSAVIEQSIQPQVVLEQRIAGEPETPLVIAERSLRACGAQAADATPCGSIDVMRSPDRMGMIVGAWDYRDETRTALVESFNERNAVSSPLPVDGLAELKGLPGREAWLALPADARSSYCVEISLPGYASTGFAVVYAQYVEESLRTQAWVFVLTHASRRWEVQHAYALPR
ncbi:MAG: hypothetical protein AB7F99_04615 [Vicinamibacterales bacterium]